MSAFTDAIATNTVRPAIVGGVPLIWAPFRSRPTVPTPRPTVPTPLVRAARRAVVQQPPESELERRAAWGDR